MASGRSSPINNASAVNASKQHEPLNTDIAKSSYSTMLPLIQESKTALSSPTALTNSVASVPVLERSFSSSHPFEIEPAVPANETRFLLEIRSKIINEMVTQKRIQLQHAEALQRAIDHVIAETAEVISWIAHSEYSTEKYKQHPVVIHYGQMLYKTMTRALTEAKSNKYLTENVVHLRNLPSQINESSSCLVNGRNIDFQGATVIIPICYGIENHLTGDALRAVTDTYLKLGASSVTVYLGEYNSVDHPYNQIAKIEKEKKESWFSKNQWLVKLSKQDPRLSILQRATLVQKADYIHAQEFIEKHILNHASIYQALAKDAMKYTENKLKNYSPKPGLTQVQKKDVARAFSENSIIESVISHVKEAKSRQQIDNMVYFTHGLMNVSQSRNALFSHNDMPLNPDPVQALANESPAIRPSHTA